MIVENDDSSRETKESTEIDRIEDEKGLFRAQELARRNC